MSNIDIDIDIEKFASTPVSGEFATRAPLLPPGDYPAVIDDVKLRKVTYTPRNGNGEQQVTIGVDVTCMLSGPEVEQVKGMSYVMLRYGFLLDLDQSGAVATGQNRNRKLGRLLEAVGLNGKEWRWADLRGRPITVRVRHAQDREDPETIYEEVTAIRKM